MTPSRILLYACLVFIVGVFVLTWSKPKQKLEAPERPVSLIGTVSEEPDVKEKSQKLKVQSSELKILVTTSRYPEYKYGDKLKVSGKLKLPSEDMNGFNYKDYLQKEGIYYVMDFPKIELIGSGFGNPVRKFLFSFKNKFKEATENLIPFPQIGFLEALIFGDESNISKEWKDKLNLTGTRHIAAVSGMNITIISGIILNALLFLGFWRQQAFYLSLILITLYILMIGAPASAIRAGVMAGVFLTAQHLGRMSAGSRALVFAAAFMLFLNPWLLRLDVGFQLSFLATLGLIYLQPHLNNWLRWIPDYRFFALKTTICVTLAAQIFTAPILIFNFGYISLISPLANILIVPFLAPLTILIFIFGLLAMILWPLGWVLSFPVFLALSYITKIIDLFSNLSFAQLKLENVPWFWLAISYLILAIVVWRLRESQKLKFLKY